MMMDDELKLKGGSGFSGMDSRKVGFARDNDTGFASKEVPTYGPRVREPQETLQIRPRAAGGGTTPYPFEITVSGNLLKSAPGLLGEIEIDSQEVVDPTDGIWSLLAKIIIDPTTGSITSSTVEWVTTVPADTTTDYHLTIANLEILDGQIYTEYNSPRQFTYGPISVVVGGGRESKWMVRML